MTQVMAASIPECMSCLGAPLLISQSLFLQQWVGSESLPLTDLGEKLQGSHISVFSTGSRTTQKLVASRITVGHPPVLQLPFQHPVSDDELPGLPIDVVLPPNMYPMTLSASHSSSSGAQLPSMKITPGMIIRRQVLGML